MNGNDVLAARRGLGLSQARLAQLLGVSVATVQAWERGRRTPSPFLDLALERLAEMTKAGEEGRE